MKKYQIDKLLKGRGMLHAIADKIGIAYQDLPSKYLIYGQNVATLVTQDPKFSVSYVPTNLQRTKWIDDLADLIQNDSAYKNIIKGDLKDYALQIIGYFYESLKEEYPFESQRPMRKALPNEPQNPDGSAKRPNEFRLRFVCTIIKINNMGQ